MQKFVGTVNGVNYDNKEQYNDAIKKALDNNVPFSASYKMEQLSDDTPTDVGSALDRLNHELLCYDLDELRGTDDDHEAIDDITADCTFEHAKQVAKEAKEQLTEEEQKLFIGNILRVIDNLKEDLRDNRDAAVIGKSDVDNRLAKVQQLERQLVNARIELEEARKRMTLLEHAEEILRMEKKYFEAMLTKRDDTPVTTCEEKETQQETDPELTFDKVTEALKKMFNIF